MRRSIRLRPNTLERLWTRRRSQQDVADLLGVSRATVARHIYGLGNDEPSNALLAGIWATRGDATFDDLFEVVEEDDDEASAVA
ncbi:MAG: hypothetical protein J2P19_32820 [Pseudonocardia sp.]|nr:hypothetical protein [Pseudonocardia sp.]